jgi:glycosyltransferase
MRVLMIPTPVPTHFTPLVPLGWALRAAGHDVLVATQPDMLPAVEAAGLNGVSVGVGFHMEERQQGGLQPDERPLETHGRHALEAARPGWIFAMHATYMWQAYIETARLLRADVVVADPLESTSLVVGGVLGIPVYQHRWGVDPLSGAVRREAAVMLRGQCERLGLEKLPEPTALLDPCPPKLQIPDIDPGLPFRFVPFNGNGPLPAWVDARFRAERSRPRVLVTLGARTLDLNGVPFVRDFLAAFGRMPGIEVLATIPARHRTLIGDLPDTVRMVDPAPLNLLLDGCDVVVHHGGAGTTMTATAHGLPQLVLPQLADQFAHGDRLRDTGAGLTFDTAEQQNNPDLLCEALNTLLTDPGYARAAGDLRQDMRNQPPLAEIVAAMETGAMALAGR